MCKKIKILHAFLPGTLGGVFSYLMNVYRNIDRERFDVKFLVFSDTKLCNYEEVKEDTIYITPRNKNYFKFLKELKEIYKDGNFDYIHCHLWSFTCFEHILLADKYSNAKVILHSHVATLDLSSFNFKTVLLDKIGKKLVYRNKEEYVFSGCSELAIRSLFGENIKNFVVLKNGIDIKKYSYNYEARKRIRKDLKINEDTVVIGHVGNFVDVKNHTKIIKVFNQIQKENQNYALLLLGSGNEIKNSILAYAEENNILNKIMILENVQNVYEYLSAMDIFMFPSTSEGLGIALIEAEANGLPCLISEAIPKEAVLTPKVQVLSLEESDRYWARKIIETKIEENRIVDYKFLKEYDIKNSVKELEKVYLENKKMY